MDANTLERIVLKVFGCLMAVGVAWLVYTAAAEQMNKVSLMLECAVPSPDKVCDR